MTIEHIVGSSSVSKGIKQDKRTRKQLIARRKAHETLEAAGEFAYAMKIMMPEYFDPSLKEAKE